MSIETKDDREPGAVMSDEELRRWNALTPEEQLLRLRKAIRTGIESGPSSETMDQIWARLRARHPDAKP
jgi:hypothetical protein